MSRDYGAGLAAAFQAFLTTSAQNKQMEWERERYEKQYQMEQERLEMVREEHRLEMRRLENAINEQERNTAEANRIKEYLTAKGYPPEQIALSELQWNDEERDMRRDKFDLDIASARSLINQRNAAAQLSAARMAQIARAQAQAEALTPEQRLINTLFPGVLGPVGGDTGGGGYSGGSRGSTPKAAKPEDLRAFLSSPEKYLAENHPDSLPAFITAKGNLERVQAEQEDVLKMLEANSTRDPETGEVAPRNAELDSMLQQRLASLNQQAQTYSRAIEPVFAEVMNQFIPDYLRIQGPPMLTPEEEAARKKKKDSGEEKDKSYITHAAKEFGKSVAGGAKIVSKPVTDAAGKVFDNLSAMNRMDETGEAAREQAKDTFFSTLEDFFSAFSPTSYDSSVLFPIHDPANGKGSIADAFKRIKRKREGAEE